MIFKLLDTLTAGGGSVVSTVTSEAARLYVPLSEGNLIALPGLLPAFQSQIDQKLWDKSESEATSS